MYIDIDQSRLDHDVIELIDVETLSIPLTESQSNRASKSSSRIYNTFASGVNVYINAHDDQE